MSSTPYMLQCASKWCPLSCSGGGIGSGPGQEVFVLVRFYLLMLCSGTQPSARQAGGTIRCTVLFLMGSLPQSRFRFLHQRAHPPARPAAFFPSAAQCQCQPCQVTKKVSQALTNARTQSRAQCCPQGGCMILSEGLTNWKIGLLSFLILGWSTLNCAN